MNLNLKCAQRFRVNTYMLAIIANYLFNVFIQFKSCAYFIVNQLILFLLYK